MSYTQESRHHALTGFKRAALGCTDRHIHSDYLGLALASDACPLQDVLRQQPRTGHGMTRIHLYEFGLDKNEANFVALSPLSFIERGHLGRQQVLDVCQEKP